MEVGNNTPPDRNRSICANGVSVGAIYSAENGDASGSRNAFLRLGGFANALKLAVALWCEGECFWDRTKNVQSLE